MFVYKLSTENERVADLHMVQIADLKKTYYNAVLRINLAKPNFESWINLNGMQL